MFKVFTVTRGIITLIHNEAFYLECTSVLYPVALDPLKTGFDTRLQTVKALYLAAAVLFFFIFELCLFCLCVSEQGMEKAGSLSDPITYQIFHICIHLPILPACLFHIIRDQISYSFTQIM